MERCADALRQLLDRSECRHLFLSEQFTEE
jgi:hypothetical protein